MIKIATTALLLLALMTTSLQPPRVYGKDLPFGDIGSSYAREAIIRLYEKGLMNGTTSTRFSPTEPISRAEFAVILQRLLGLEPVDSPIPAYEDVPGGAWYYEGVQASTEVGLTAGKGPRRFAPAEPVSRQETAVWLSRILNTAIAIDSVSPTAGKYKDDAAIAVWARPQVYAVSKLGLMNGNGGNFFPEQALTRQEIAAVMDRLLQNPAWAAKLSSPAWPTVQIGWQYGQTDAQFKQSVLNSNINVLSPRWFLLAEDGSVSIQSQPSLVAWAKQQGKQVWPLFGNRFDQATTHALLTSTTKSSEVITRITNTAVQTGVQGINLDFENVAPKDREAFTSFVAELARRLHVSNIVLSLDLSPDFQTDWTEAYDYAALGKIADYIVMMGYDEHWSGGSAGSVASLPWLEKGLDNLLQEVPSSKVILALPLFTRDWMMDGGAGTSAPSEDLNLPQQFQRIKRFGAKPVWNDKLGQYVADYRSSGAQRRIWLEETRSLTSKYSLAMSKDIAGFAFWHIGGETPEIWPALRNAAKYDAIVGPGN
ncbi:MULTISPECIES: S-layer homology domain-containing protein [Paenibacillus]|uniref:S-layer homology domain-containing protein n=1 Tax=Paenibacillus TaxID=44249 RepID=UPI002FE1ACDB